MRKCRTCKWNNSATGVMNWCEKNHDDCFYVKYKRCKDYEKREYEGEQ